MSQSKKPQKRPERLHIPIFSGLKDAALRKKMAEQGISADGSRQLMEKRYTEWVTLWNADCDSNHPKGRAALKRELDIWERTQGGRATIGGREQVIGNQIKDKDFDHEAWGKSNDDEFKKLIANARRKAAPTTKTDSGSGSTSAEKSASNSEAPQERPNTEMIGRGPLEPLPLEPCSPQASLPPIEFPLPELPTVEASPTKNAMPQLYRNSSQDASMLPPSSQYQPSSYQQTSSLNQDAGINSDSGTIRVLQP